MIKVATAVLSTTAKAKAREKKKAAAEGESMDTVSLTFHLRDQLLSNDVRMRKRRRTAMLR